MLVSPIFGAHHTEASESQVERPESGADSQGASTPHAEAPLSSFPNLTSVCPDADARERDGTDERELASCELEMPAFSREHGFEPQNKTIPHHLGDCAAPVPIQLETRGTTSQKILTFQRELWARQTVHKNSVAAKLREVGMEGVALALELCHTEATYATCKGCGKHKRFLNRCEKFYCPECQPTLSKDRERSVGWWSREMHQPKHVVLTLQNLPTIDKAVVMHAKKCFARLRRRVFAKNWVGGFYNWEVTKEVAGTVKNGHVCSGGWHLHVHALVEAKWIDSHVLSAEWDKVTGGYGRIVKVMDARRVDYLKEVTKYAVKGSQLAAWSGDEIKMFINAFTGVRTFGVFGSLYGKRTEWREWIEQLHDHALKCECGCNEWWYQSEADWTIGGGMAMLEAPTNGPNVTSKLQLAFDALS